MAGSRTLKLTILGDVADLSKSLTTANKDVDGFGDKVGKVGAAVGAAFVAAAAAAGAYAVKIGVDSVNAAIADEKAQTQLATAITAATGATNAQIAAVEMQITKTSLATGVADDQLRPALGRLVLATNSTSTAQGLLNTALDVSAATGKPLETVTNALAKAYEGNTTALGKLGVGYGAAELKGKDFNTIVGELNTQFGGAAATAAGTYQGQIDKLKVGFDEAKESLGVALLPVIQTFITFLNDTALPAVLKVVGAFTDKESGLNQGITNVTDTLKNVAEPIWEGLVKAFGFIKEALAGSKTEFESFANVVKTVAPVLGTVLGGVITVIGKIASVVLALIAKVAGAIAPILNTAIDGINLVIRGLNLVNPGEDIPQLKKIGSPVGTPGFSGTTPGGQSFAGTLTVPKIPGVTTTTSGTTTTATTGGKTGVAAAGLTTASKVAATAAASTGIIVGSNFNPGAFRAAEAATNPPTINLTVNGAIDSEGTARTIVQTLNDSFYRGTGGASSLQIA
jgi:hypothetical protein